MRSLALALLVVGALLAPSAAFAAGDPTSPPSRYFVITGLVFGDRTVVASGKLGVEGRRLFASVGCNTISGTVSVEGDRLTIVEPLAMTEMGCLGTAGDTEAMLIKILQAGPFTIHNGAWTGNGAAILVEELPAAPGPGASLTPPDGVVSSSFQPGAVEPTVSCAPIPVDVNGASPAGGGPNGGSGGSAGGSGGSAGGSGGSAGGSGGSAGGSGGSAGGSGGSTGGGTSTEATSAPAATAIDLPLATAVVEPAGNPATPGIAPAGTAVAEPGTTIEPAPTAEAGGTAEPEGGTGPGIGTDPGVGKPLASDPCAERMAAIDGGFSGGTTVAPPKAADATAEHSSSLADASVVAQIGIGVGLVALVALIGLLAIRRARASGPSAEGGRRGGAS